MFKSIKLDKDCVVHHILIKKGKKRHNSLGPAKIRNGIYWWFINGKLHRKNAPAYVDLTTGETQWWINGKRLDNSKEEVINYWWKLVHHKNLAYYEFVATEDQNNQFNYDGDCFISALKLKRKGKYHNSFDYARICLDTKYHYKNGKYHNKNGPAIEDSKYNQYYVNGKPHRLDGPAIIADDYERWCRNGKFHRVDGPAIIVYGYYKYRTEWFIDGIRHREYYPAVESFNGTKEWWINGDRHRQGGPAVEYENGSLEYWENGKRHRIDGPAIIVMADRKRTGKIDRVEWFANGSKFSKEKENMLNIWYENKQNGI